VEARRHPAALAEAVRGRLGVRQLERLRPALRQLARDAERLALAAEGGEGLVLDREVEVAGPRALRVRARVGKAEGTQLEQDAVGIDGSLRLGHADLLKARE